MSGYYCNSTELKKNLHYGGAILAKLHVPMVWQG